MPVKHVPREGEVRVKVVGGKCGVMRLQSTFGPFVSVKLDGTNEWRFVQRN